ncbi:MAG: 50S ribosomal protein L24 [Elusimicrobia bacterium GWA2_56_46]|nr:MAG: 50S ribosomal protein L24 [Elusimicrobia bacterium GWA2_56_46]OGR55011.1 MAG: 50S ribosomal protein L24 [Elusimicrobia bacterium GWC2_56_31]HBW23976.1 50S ribosomal protein L24 [Elusimicrobiota bacterium]
MLRLKKKDMVMVMAGKDKGKKGEIKEMHPETGKVVVMGVNIVSKHKRTTKEKPGGIHKLEAPIHISNVQLICPKCAKPVKIKVIPAPSGDKMRACRKCGEVIL